MSHTADETIGHAEGDLCGRQLTYGPRCEGRLGLRAPTNCSCHISPPCAACMAPRHFCPVCGWEEANDIVFNDHIVNVHPVTQIWQPVGLRALRADRIDWHSFEHTHFTMRRKGVYPPGTTREQVETEVCGTFGGRFDQFGDGTFDYVAYTD